MPKQIPNLVTEDTQEELKTDQFGLYALYITASCQKAHDLRITIDDLEFREIPPDKNIQVYNIPAAWNGNELQGLTKTIIFLIKLDAGTHTLTFLPKNQAHVENWELQQIEDPAQLSFNLDNQAEDGNGRPWYTFVLVDLPFKSLTAQATVDWHLFDGDDVKVVVDNEIALNPTSKRWKNWLWHAVPTQLISGAKTEEKTVTKDLPQDTHYLEIWADKTPILHRVILDLGEFKLQRVPTKENPLWTGDFADDSEVMILARLIFGEARNQSQAAMTGVAWVVKNRLQAKRSYFGSSYHDIITKHNQNSYQFSSFNPEKENFPFLTDPLTNRDMKTKQAWATAYTTAQQVINGTSSDPTGGATFFHSQDLSRSYFETVSAPGAVFTTQIGAFLFYLDPNDT